MAQVSSVLRTAVHGPGKSGFIHWCPGCEEAHYIQTAGDGPNWSFDGNVEKPTFGPSVKIEWTGGSMGGTNIEKNSVCIDKEKDRWQSICHYFIRNGQIEYCSDSTHQLSGKTISLPALPEHISDKDEEV